MNENRKITSIEEVLDAVPGLQTASLFQVALARSLEADRVDRHLEICEAQLRDALRRLVKIRPDAAMFKDVLLFELRCARELCGEMITECAVPDAPPRRRRGR